MTEADGSSQEKTCTYIILTKKRWQSTKVLSLLLATSTTGPITVDESAQKAFKRLKELFASALILT